jgi:hypothetical protein
MSRSSRGTALSGGPALKNPEAFPAATTTSSASGWKLARFNQLDEAHPRVRGEDEDGTERRRSHPAVVPWASMTYGRSSLSRESSTDGAKTDSTPAARSSGPQVARTPTAYSRGSDSSGWLPQSVGATLPPFLSRRIDRSQGCGTAAWGDGRRCTSCVRRQQETSMRTLGLAGAIVVLLFAGGPPEVEAQATSTRCLPGGVTCGNR